METDQLKMNLTGFVSAGLHRRGHVFICFKVPFFMDEDSARHVMCITSAQNIMLALSSKERRLDGVVDMRLFGQRARVSELETDTSFHHKRA
jgi:hypothetical protein